MTRPETKPSTDARPEPRPGSPAGSALAIRTARSSDIPEILEVVQAAYRGEGGWTTEAHLVRGQRADKDEVQALLADSAVLLLVAVRDGRVVGCAYTRRESSSAELGLFAVDPRAQAGGIGGRLLETQASRLADAGVETLRLQVLQSRPELHAWYERHGFTKTGRLLPFPVDPGLLTDPNLQMEEMARPLRST